jgi:hypothetical protein
VWVLVVVGGFGGEGVSVSSFVYAGVGALPAGWVEACGEFMSGSVVLVVLRGGGKAPRGR